MICYIPNKASEDKRAYVDDGLLKIFGFYGFEHREGLSNPCIFTSKRQIFELRGIRDVKRSCIKHAYVPGQG